MISKVKISQVLCTSTIMLLVLPFSTSNNLSLRNVSHPEQYTQGLYSFGIRLHSELTKANPDKNIFISPFSIQTCSAMVRMGAKGNTAAEMDRGLNFSSDNPKELADNYHAILTELQNSSVITVANKMYIKQSYPVRPNFNQMLTEKFLAPIDSINFGDSETAALTINNWVENKTNNLIKDLMSPSSFNNNTRLVLISAIHFKDSWVFPFSKKNTKEQDFYLDETNTVKVQMMNNEKEMYNGILPDLDATAVEVPYSNSGLSMLIILPNSRTGLADLEKKLQTASLDDITNSMEASDVILSMPKFKVEYEVKLSEPFKKMGMNRMFTEYAQFGKMIQSCEKLYVSEIVHKAFIEVNEEGSEAGAASGYAIPGFKMAPPRPVKFVVDRPFYYAIKNEFNVVLFEGNVKNIFSEKKNLIPNCKSGF